MLIVEGGKIAVEGDKRRLKKRKLQKIRKRRAGRGSRRR